MTPSLRLLAVRPGRDRVGRAVFHASVGPADGVYARRHLAYGPTTTICVRPSAMATWESFERAIRDESGGAYLLNRPRPGEVPGLPAGLAAQAG